jgi:hypothetical protein
MFGCKMQVVVADLRFDVREREGNRLEDFIESLSSVRVL